MQFAFAGIYFMIYRRKRGHFAFNIEILRQQSESKEVLFEQTAERLRGVHSAFLELETRLKANEEPEDLQTKTSVRLDSGVVCTVAIYSYPPHGGECPKFEVSDVKGKKIFEFNTYGSWSKWTGPPRPKTAKDWLDTLPGVLAVLQKQEKSIARRVESLSTSAPDVWSYLDFVYFSTIVQTTVGFGDILPNSTIVRMVVATQIVVGYALLVVVLNIVLGS
jgi:hypothetical protein